MNEKPIVQEISVGQALSRAKKAIKNRDLALAHDLYKSIISVEPQNPVAKKGLKKITASLPAKKLSSNKKINDPHIDDINNINRLFDSGNNIDVEAYCQNLIPKYPSSVFLLKRISDALLNQDKFDRSIDYLERLLLIDPQHVAGLHNYGLALMKLGQPNQAVEQIKRANIFQKANSKDVKSYLADLLIRSQMLLEMGALDSAISIFDEVISISPNYAEAFFHRGRAMVSLDQFVKAFDDFGVAVSLDKTREDYLDYLCFMLDYITFDHYRPELDPFFIKILERKATDPRRIAATLLSAITKNKDLAQELSKPEAGELSDVRLDRLVIIFSKISPIIMLMEKTPLPDWELEQLLVKIRRKLLSRVSSGDNVAHCESFVVTLAMQCFINEFCYITSREEERQIDLLASRISEKLQRDEAPLTIELAIVGCYRSLNMISFISEHRHLLPNEKLDRLLRQQCDDPAIELIYAREVNKLKPISDSVSELVAAQYEQNPYPRWTDVAVSEPDNLEALISRYLTSGIGEIKYPTKPKVLIAGCGTGRQSIMTACGLEDSDVLAIDLSLASLGYAIRKTNEMGIRHIEYMHADILDLEQVGRTFDIIESQGVLHHMADPMAGWQILTSLLRPNGLMNIGLYSETAREVGGVVSARNKFERYQTNISQDNVRNLRKDVVCEINSGSIERGLLSSPDFYSLSSFRDLICHVQEHRYTIPMIKESCEILGLEFLGFVPITQGVTKDFLSCYPGDNSLCNLDMWEEYEKENPSTFSAMYNFWLRKIG